jgi:hypothetical protein
MALRRTGACSRNNPAAAVSAERAALPCQLRRRPLFPRASKGVTLQRIIRFAS